MGHHISRARAHESKSHDAFDLGGNIQHWASCQDEGMALCFEPRWKMEEVQGDREKMAHRAVLCLRQNPRPIPHCL
jgi:hypothetical protein